MRTYEEIVAEVNEIHPCSEKEAAMLYAEQFKPQWIEIDKNHKPPHFQHVYLWADDGKGVDSGSYNEIRDLYIHASIRSVLMRKFTHYSIIIIPEPPKQDEQ